MLKPGYKQTEVGIIPEDWTVCPLDDFADVLSSKRIFEADYVASGIPFYRGKEVSLLIQKKDIDEAYFISEARYQAIVRTFGAPSKNDILITAVGTLGNIYLIPDNNPFYFKDGNLIWMRSIKGICPIYLASQLKALKGYIIDNAIGSTQKALTINVLNGTPIPLPPTLAEQEAIAEALSDADGLIESLEQLIAKKRAIKQGAMQNLLTGKKRLPGFSGKWETKRLGDVVENIVGGGTPARGNSEYWGKEIPWATVKDFTTFDPQRTQEFITATGLQNSASHLIAAGTLITSTRMAVGKAVIYDVAVAINQDLKALYPIKELQAKFLFYWFKANEAQLLELGSGSTVIGISLPDLKSLPFNYPSSSEQKAIATVLSDMDLELEALGEKLAKARQIKQGMMSELLTGKTRLVAHSK